MKIIRDLLLFMMFVGLLQTFMQRDMRSGATPDLPIKTLSGENSAKLLANKPAIIYFWGSWCGICAAIQGTISEVLHDYPGITVALRSGNNANVLSYMKKHKLNWQVINDNDGALAESFGVSAVPVVFFLGSDGEISFISLGYVTEIGLRVRLWWLSSGYWLG